jgi:flagellar motor switch protein FliG
MAAQSGDQMAVTLLRVLPADVAEQVLGRLDPAAGQSFRTAIEAAAGPPAGTDLDAALSEFFDLLRIADRGRAVAPAGEYRPVAGSAGGGRNGGAGAGADQVVSLEPVDPIASLRELPADKLLKVLDGEPPAVTALLLNVLDSAAAAAVLKGLPTDQRAAVALRFSQPGNRNYPLIQQLARAVAEKGRRLAEQPTETAPDARIADLAAMLRGLPRQERIDLFGKMNETDPDLSERVKDKLFRFDDVLKLDDRSLQGLLAQLNLKVVAVSLKGADEQLTAKVTNNISSRARELLQEEIGLLGNISSAQVEEARTEVVRMIRQGEEEGRFVISD